MTDQNDFFENMNGPTEAGGMIVMMNQDAKSSASIKMLEKSAGVKVASSRDFSASSEKYRGGRRPRRHDVPGQTENRGDQRRRSRTDLYSFQHVE